MSDVRSEPAEDVQTAEADVRWERVGDEWHGEMFGRVHDYGDGAGAEEQDAFLAVLSPGPGVGWTLAIEHESRGGGAERTSVGAVPIEEALREAETAVRAFRESWEASIDDGGYER